MRKILSLGVGIQSTALYYMSSLNELDRCDWAIFSDTGGEKTATLEYYEFMLEWMKKNNGIPLHVASYKNLEEDLKDNSNSEGGRFSSIPAFTLFNGKKGMLRRQCTGEYKIAPVNKKSRELLGIEGRKRLPKTEIWIGITLDENHRMVIPQEKWKVHVYPFCGYKIYPDGKSERLSGFEMTRNDVLNWYNINNLPIPEKSSCKFCPFQADYNWLRLKKNSPEDFKDAIEIDKLIRNSSKKGVKAPLFLHSSLKPLDEVDFSENQTTLWGNCTDACDV